MKGIWRYIKSWFGKYESGYEYWVNTKDINVDPEWRYTPINKLKFDRKMKYWNKNGEFESKILLDKDFNLIDGYTSVVIAEIKDIERVPVYFVTDK